MGKGATDWLIEVILYAGLVNLVCQLPHPPATNEELVECECSEQGDQFSEVMELVLQWGNYPDFELDRNSEGKPLRRAAVKLGQQQIILPPIALARFGEKALQLAFHDQCIPMAKRAWNLCQWEVLHSLPQPSPVVQCGLLLHWHAVFSLNFFVEPSITRSPGRSEMGAPPKEAIGENRFGAILRQIDVTHCRERIAWVEASRYAVKPANMKFLWMLWNTVLGNTVLENFQKERGFPGDLSGDSMLVKLCSENTCGDLEASGPLGAGVAAVTQDSSRKRNHTSVAASGGPSEKEDKRQKKVVKKESKCHQAKGEKGGKGSEKEKGKEGKGSEKEKGKGGKTSQKGKVEKGGKGGEGTKHDQPATPAHGAPGGPKKESSPPEDSGSARSSIFNSILTPEPEDVKYMRLLDAVEKLAEGQAKMRELRQDNKHGPGSKACACKQGPLIMQDCSDNKDEPAKCFICTGWAIIYGIARFRCTCPDPQGISEDFLFCTYCGHLLRAQHRAKLRQKMEAEEQAMAAASNVTYVEQQDYLTPTEWEPAAGVAKLVAAAESTTEEASSPVQTDANMGQGQPRITQCTCANPHVPRAETEEAARKGECVCGRVLRLRTQRDGDVSKLVPVPICRCGEATLDIDAETGAINQDASCLNCGCMLPSKVKLDLKKQHKQKQDAAAAAKAAKAAQEQEAAAAAAAACKKEAAEAKQKAKREKESLQHQNMLLQQSQMVMKGQQDVLISQMMMGSGSLMGSGGLMAAAMTPPIGMPFGTMMKEAAGLYANPHPRVVEIHEDPSEQHWVEEPNRDGAQDGAETQQPGTQPTHWQHPMQRQPNQYMPQHCSRPGHDRGMTPPPHGGTTPPPMARPRGTTPPPMAPQQLRQRRAPPPPAQYGPPPSQGQYGPPAIYQPRPGAQPVGWGAIHGAQPAYATHPSHGYGPSAPAPQYPPRPPPNQRGRWVREEEPYGGHYHPNDWDEDRDDEVHRCEDAYCRHSF